jgi:hypothetical protein
LSAWRDWLDLESQSFDALDPHRVTDLCGCLSVCLPDLGVEPDLPGRSESSDDLRRRSDQPLHTDRASTPPRVADTEDDDRDLARGGNGDHRAGEQVGAIYSGEATLKIASADTGTLEPFQAPLLIDRPPVAKPSF